MEISGGCELGIFSYKLFPGVTINDLHIELDDWRAKFGGKGKLVLTPDSTSGIITLTLLSTHPE